MQEDVYQKLAERLDTIPNGFTATQSGSHLRLLAKLFTPEEAAMAAVMRLTPEPMEQIAERAKADPKAAYRLLKEMARKGLIAVSRGEKRLTFSLMPFAIGIYEAQLPRMDAELAALFEEYYREVRGGTLTGSLPPVHRVIPVEEAISMDLEIFPYERASQLIESARSWGVRECICRLQQRLIGKDCGHPLETCLVFALTEHAFDHSAVDRAISKEEALHILRQAEDAGLVHTTGNYRDGHSYICNCCTCCCGILRAAAEFSVPTAVATSGFQAVVDGELCQGCEQCLERCRFGALSLRGGICQVDELRCVGCGLCASVCPTQALHLVRRAQASAPPSDLHEWMRLRAQERGIPLEDIL